MMSRHLKNLPAGRTETEMEKTHFSKFYLLLLVSFLLVTSGCATSTRTAEELRVDEPLQSKYFLPYPAEQVWDALKGEVAQQPQSKTLAIEPTEHFISWTAIMDTETVILGKRVNYIKKKKFVTRLRAVAWIEQNKNGAWVHVQHVLHSFHRKKPLAILLQHPGWSGTSWFGAELTQNIEQQLENLPRGFDE